VAEGAADAAADAAAEAAEADVFTEGQFVEEQLESSDEEGAPLAAPVGGSARCGSALGASLPPTPPLLLFSSAAEHQPSTESDRALIMAVTRAGSLDAAREELIIQGIASSDYPAAALERRYKELLDQFSNS